MYKTSAAPCCVFASDPNKDGWQKCSLVYYELPISSGFLQKHCIDQFDWSLFRWSWRSGGWSVRGRDMSQSSWSSETEYRDRPSRRSSISVSPSLSHFPPVSVCLCVRLTLYLCVLDNRLLEKSDLQAVLSERYQTDKYDVQRGHEARWVHVTLYHGSC